MLSDNAAADNWKAWLDDLPLDACFDEGVGRVQDFISGTVARAEAAEAENATLRGRLARMEGAQKLREEIAALANLCDCDCDGDDCVRCSHYPAILEQKRKQLAAITDGGSNG